MTIRRLLLVGLLVLGTADAKPDKNASPKNSRSSEKDDESQNKRTWQADMDQITCCNGGTPIISENLVRNFTIIPSDYTIEERTVDDVTMNCRDFEVRYLAQRNQILSEPENEPDAEIKLRCKCPESNPAHTLDSNCRRLLSCKNNGFRSPTYPHHCICAHPFFGERCEKYCDQGQRLKGHNGRDYCSCVPFYQGEECRDMLCLNGGREINSRCVCPPEYLGYHCEINTNHTGPGGTRFQRFGDQSGEMFTRDISGTIFSLIMIVVLVVSMYLLMKHRMQTRYLNRRPDLLGACNFPIPASVVSGGGVGPGCLSSARRSDLISPDDPRFYTFRQITATLPDTGPPPYFQHRGRRGAREVLPPLPTYEDATKLPPLRNNISADDPNAVEFVEERVSDESPTPRAQATQTTTGTSAAEAQATPNNSLSSTTTNATILATVRGTEMVRSANTTTPANRHSDADSAGTPLHDQHAETVSLESGTSVSSDSSASTKPEQR